MGTLELRDVTKRYGAVVAVDNVNFRADDGEFLALLGPSGCGKSSTMRMIAGLEAISEGDILIDGHRVNERTPRERNVALAFESYALYTPLTVYENLAFPLRNGKIPGPEVDRRVRDIAEQFELTELLKRKPGHLSGGQSQRVSLARALIRKPHVLLLDEPLSHLDHRLRVVLRARIRHIHDTAGGTPTVYVTHDQEEAVALADRIIVMNHAVIQQIGTFEELLERADLLDHGVVHHDDAVGERHCLFLIVGDIDRWCATGRIVDVADAGAKHDAQPVIEMGQRFVEQKDMRFADQRPRQADALALAAGEVSGFPLQELRQLELLRDIAHTPIDFRPRNLPVTEREGEVLVHRERRIEGIGLEGERDVPLPRRAFVDAMPVDQDVPLGDRLEPGNHAHRRTLAAAGRTEEREELAIVGSEVDIVDGDHRAVALGDVAQFKRAHHLASPGCLERLPEVVGLSHVEGEAELLADR